MQTVQMTLDEQLLAEVDTAVKQMGTSRSAFTREALRTALAAIKEKALEARHRAGYARNPVEPDEFDGWEHEQVWIDG